MNKTFSVCCALILFIDPAVAVWGSEPSPESRREITAAVRVVFSAKCAACHGPQVAKPKGRFGYVLDLARIAANPEMVVPGKPAESELWELIRRDEMPPEDASTGRLTARQKEAIRVWIEAGAPADTAPTADPPASDSVGPTGESEPALWSRLWHALHWLGKFHLLLLHFPIALLVTAAAGEVWFALRGERCAASAVRFCVCCGAAAAVPTALFGWLYAAGSSGFDSTGLLSWHRWVGTAAAAWAVATAFVLERDSRRGTPSTFGRFMVLSGAILVGAAAHFGGLLVHGEDFFKW